MTRPDGARAAFFSVLVAASLAARAGPVRADDGHEREWRACATAAENVQSLRDHGKLRNARAQALSCSRALCPVLVRRDCERWLGELDESLPTVVIRALDSDRDVTTVTVDLDGEPFLAHLDGIAAPVDPGQRRFVYRAAGYAPVAETVLVAQGEKNRRILVHLRPAVAVTGGGSAAVAASDGNTTRFGPGFWTAAAFAGAGWVSFAAFGISALSERSSLSSSCAPEHDCTSADHDVLRNRALAADISLGAAVVATGIAAWLATRAHVDAPVVVPSRTGMSAVWTVTY